MRSLSKGAAVGIGCFALALILLAPSLTHGDEWNLATRFTVNHESEVPGMVLQANTPYVIRLLDSPSNRNVVQIYDKDQKHMLTMFMAISAERPEPADKTVFKFIEAAPGYPLPIKEWFYPGRLNGLEFVYPKEQALSISEHAREPVLTESAANITKSESTEVVEPSVPESTPSEPSVEQKQEVKQTDLEQPTEIAQNTQPEVQQPQPVETSPETAPVTQESSELPRTAGELPLVALIGALCLGAGIGMKVLSAKM
ncbi:MAG TPA: hypothetical protein VKK06_16785 [Terriglobia bacterium]|nr:hypothetical protein [Terriglobia bacterium]